VKALSVIGIGLVSPGGLDAREHVFFVRAGTSSMGNSPFSTAEGERVRAGVCPWLGGEMAPVDRLCSLADGAVGSAIAPLGERTDDLGLWIVTDRDRPGLVEDDRRALAGHLTSWIKPATVGRSLGAAGFFGALDEAASALEASKIRAAVVVAVDSLIGIDALSDWIRTSASPWVREHRDPSEAAAAVLVTTAEEARRRRADVLGLIPHAGMSASDSHDDNDVAVDGTALARLFADMGGVGSPIGVTFGQHGLDLLRNREWDLAVVRARSRFHPECLFQCVETKIGRVGAAAGAVHTAYGVAELYHRTHPARVDGGAPALAWAISRDGTRGLCTLSRGPDA
jgi:hypothetical protein